MKKKPATKSAFFNTRVLIGLAFCSIALVLTLVAFALYPGGNALARQNQSIVQTFAAQPSAQAAWMADVPESGVLAEPGAVVQLAPGPFVPDVATAPAPQAINPLVPLVPNVTFVVNTTADTQDAIPGDGLCADSL